MTRASEGRDLLHKAIRIVGPGVDDLALVRNLIHASIRHSGIQLSSIQSGDAPASSTAFADEEFTLSCAGITLDALASQSILVGSLDGTTVAVAGWQWINRTNRTVCLPTLTVSPLFRGLGLGRMILARAEEQAAAEGADAIVAISRGSRAGFFEHLGYEALAYRRHGSGGNVRRADFGTTHLHKRMPGHKWMPGAVGIETAKPVDLDAGLPTPSRRNSRHVRSRPASPQYAASDLGLVEFDRWGLTSTASH